MSLKSSKCNLKAPKCNTVLWTIYKTFFLQDHKFVFNEQKKSDILAKIKLIYSSFTDLMDLDLENLTDPHSAVGWSVEFFFDRTEQGN